MRKKIFGKSVGVALVAASLLVMSGCGNDTAPTGATQEASQTAAAESTSNESDTATTTEETTAVSETAAADTTPADAGNGETEAASTDETPAAEDSSEAETQGEDEASADAQAEDPGVIASADALYSQISSGVVLPQMFLADSGYAENFLGLDMTKVGGFVFATAEDVTRVDSIILIEAKDDAAAESIAALLENFRAQKVAETDPAGGGYQPELHDDIVASSVGRSGNHVWLVVSPDRAAIEGIVANAWK